ncbi:hypothetical protein GCM10009720_06860 [Yaniella flava]|uniref:Uncharacterized protein n=1 Tax=Yaniella flava TaxID=287930 RepID=A0ABN2U6Q5_9MICC
MATVIGATGAILLVFSFLLDGLIQLTFLAPGLLLVVAVFLGFVFV